MPEGVFDDRSVRPLRVFLCHSSIDKPSVRVVYQRLRAEGVVPWLDEEDQFPGQEWALAVAQAVRNADVVLMCLSQASLTWPQPEIEFELDAADQQPEGALDLIVLCLDECIVPERLARWSRLDYFEERGHERLMCALRARGDSLGLCLEPPPRLLDSAVLKDMMYLPPGPFLFSSVERGELREITLDHGFWIDRRPVTNAQYCRFLNEKGNRREGGVEWINLVSSRIEGQQGRYSSCAGCEQQPIGGVSWDGAMAYARWGGKRLPTDEEWEKAARRAEGCGYAQNDYFEWTANPWSKDQDYRVLRGYSSGGDATRAIVPPYFRIHSVGFRCALTASPSLEVAVRA